MRTRHTAILSLVLLTATVGCGPIIGQVMKSSTGLKDFQVRAGSVRDFAAPRTVLVFAPFAKGEKGYYLCRGEDEWLIAAAFKSSGLFKTEYAFERDGDKAAAVLGTLRAGSPEEAKSRFGLEVAPDAVLSGVILERDSTVAPTVGVIQTLRLRLELTDLTTHATAAIEIAVKELHQDTVPLIIQEIVRRARLGG